MFTYIHFLFHPHAQQQKQQKATEHIALLANDHLNDSMFIIMCKIPTASSDRRLFFFKSHHQFLNKNNNKDILLSFLYILFSVFNYYAFINLFNNPWSTTVNDLACCLLSGCEHVLLNTDRMIVQCHCDPCYLLEFDSSSFLCVK